MKKIISVFCAFILFILSINLVFAQEYQIYVSDINVTKVEYQVGEVAEGSFILSNLSELPQSDIYYSISSGPYSEDLMGLLEILNPTQKKGPYYIKGQSQEVIQFTYDLPKSLTGKAAIEITATLKDGTLVGQYNYPINIIGSPKEEKISIMDTSLTISGFDAVIDPRTGPTVYEGESIDFNYALNPVSSVTVLTPVLQLYDRTDNPDSLKKKIELDPIELNQEVNTYSISLPTDIEPLVYFGVLSLKNEQNEEVLSTSFRYIVAGEIATIRNITTDTLEVKNGDAFSAVITYGGQPLDEYRPEKQINSASTTITIVARNEKGEDIATVNQFLDLSSENKIITIPMVAQKDAKKISFSGTITNTEGKILDEYSTILPTEDELKNQKTVFDTVNFSFVSIISFLIIVVVLLFLFFILKTKKGKFTIPTVVVIGILLISAFFSGSNNAIAGLDGNAAKYLEEVASWDDIFINQAIMGWRVLQASSKRTAFDTTGGFLLESQPSFKITSVSSPLPPILKSYNPGERFYLKFNAVYGDCNNHSKQYYAFAYPSTSNWWNKKPDLAGGEEGNDAIVQRLTYWQKEGKNLLPDQRLGDGFNDIILILGQNLNLSDMIGLTAEKETAMKRLMNNTYPVKHCVDFSSGKFTFCAGSRWSLTLDASNYFSWFSDDKEGQREFDKIQESKMIAFLKARNKSIENVRDILLTAPGQPLAEYPGLRIFNFGGAANLKNSYGDEYTKQYAQAAHRLNRVLVEYTDPVIKKIAESGLIDGSEHDTSLLHLDMQRVYTAPTEPGYHRMYFYINQYGNQGYKDLTAVQLICVRGKGVCPDENQNAPIADIKLVDRITKNTARVNWTYSDKDGDKQIQYQIQVSTDKTFKNTVLIKTAWSGRGDTLENKDIRNHVLTGLKANTTYFVRMKSKSSAKQEPIWSEWTNGAYSFTTANSLCPNDDSYTEGEIICEADKYYQYNYNEETCKWDRTPTGDTCATSEEINFSCSVSPKSVYVNEEVTYTATQISKATYRWFRDSSKTKLITGETSNIYKTSYSSEGQYPRYVEVKYTDDLNKEVVDMAICTVNVSEDPDDSNCGNKPSNRICAPGVSTSRTYTTCNQSTKSWNYIESSCGGGEDDRDSNVINFYFNPDTVSLGEYCPLYLEVENTTGCKLIDRFGTVKKEYSANSEYRISVNSDRYGVGTYSLLCSGVGETYASPKKRATKSCYSKPDIQED